MLVPLGEGHARRQGVLAGDLLVIEIGDGGAFVHLSEPVDHPGVGKDRRRELRLTRTSVPDKRDISDEGGVVDLH